MRKFELMRNKGAALGVTQFTVTHVQAPPQQMAQTNWGSLIDKVFISSTPATSSKTWQDHFTLHAAPKKYHVLRAIFEQKCWSLLSFDRLIAPLCVFFRLSFLVCKHSSSHIL